MPVEPSTPTSLVPLLIIAVVALAGAIAYLFRFYSGRMEAKDALLAKEREERAKERENWVVERTRHERFQVELRAEYETKYHDTLKTLYDDAREHEDTARREYTENIETVSANAQAASEKVTRVLDKLYDYLAPRRTPRGGG
jgi:flagellar basal body-associated protein FliL